MSLVNNLLFVGGSGLLGNNWININLKKIYATINKNKINLNKQNISYLKLDLLDEKKTHKICLSKQYMYNYKCCSFN